LANGRLAMLAIIGLFSQEGLIGRAWSDWALYTASPLRALGNELGLLDSGGFWDPADFTADGNIANFARRRQYVVSIRSGSRRTRLHLVGACHRIPGRDYQEFEVLGDQLPPASAYADFCRQCWPGGRPVRFSEADDVDSADTTSSSSDAEGSA
jgi:hypothetical protein